MWYIPFVRARRALIVYSYIVAAFALLGVAIRFMPHASAHNDATVPPLDISGFAVAAASIIAGLATVMGLNLASENDGHLEVAWAKPISREWYAMGLFGVDLIVMAVAYVLTLVCAIALCDFWAGHQVIVVRQPLMLDVAVLAFPFYIYAIVVALSASLKRNRGVAAGLLWPALIALLVASKIIRVDSVQAVLHAVNTINPVVVFSSQNGAMAPAGNYALGFALTAVCLGIALVQWRRLEA